MSEKVHTHWLFGSGPNKEVKLPVYIEVETKCGGCIHNHVCRHDMTAFCSNYEFGDSKDMRHCQSCSHKYSRFDKEPVPCFHCKHFEPKKAS